jgi:NAD(P)-dependent dehydrogenase (short-subunit alcohol dehydrogenase family)
MEGEHMAYKPFDLSGKVALITGGNGGIGLGMAEALADAGADVVIWGMNPTKNADAKARLEAKGTRILVSTVDVTIEEAVVNGMAEAAATMGRLDFVAANAGIGKAAKSFETMDTGLLSDVLAVNLYGAFWTLREACKHMAERSAKGDKGGSLLITSSTGIVHGAAAGQAYGASKGAVAAMMRGIAVEYAKHGIRANAVLPGWTRADLTAPLQNWEKFNDRVINGRVPMKRWGEPDDFGGIAVYLASDASRFHTGDTIVIDGGYTVF